MISELSLSAKELYNKIDNEEDVFILDIRAEEDYDEWHITHKNVGIMNYPYFNMLSEIPTDLKSELPDDKEIITVCAKGKSSEMISEMLVEEGYTSQSLDTGMIGWADVLVRKEIPTQSSESKIYQYIRPSSGCLSYLIKSGSDIAIIDPLHRFVDRYIEDANKMSAEIRYSIDTHIHADHVSGLYDLSEETNAERVVLDQVDNRGIEYDVTKVEDGHTLQLGDTEIEVMFAPGHTTGQTAFYNNGVLFTGDSIFIDSIARPDLEDADESEEMASVLYDTVTNIITEYDDDTIIAPAHASENTKINANINDTYTAYLIDTLEEIDALSYSKSNFVDYIVTDMPSKPSNFKNIIEYNKGLTDESDDTLFELELGPNNCASSN